MFVAELYGEISSASVKKKSSKRLVLALKKRKAATWRALVASTRPALAATEPAELEEAD